ncbi:WhiB family transcriptional regulator [Microbacterium oryzae]|uniref:WhiB family transcriptional regulator n=1 Tax=Microbacterium oryzae TaxID=743009 RepID=UPI00339D77E9
MNADAAWDALNAVLHDYTPPCDGRVLFTADELTDEQRATCAVVCATCPIADLCGSYAAAAKVDSGFWAGADRSPKRKRATKTTAPGGSRHSRK